MLKHADATGTTGDGRKLQDKHFKVTIETIRAKTAELAATMNSGQNPDGYFTEAIIKRPEARSWARP